MKGMLLKHLKTTGMVSSRNANRLLSYFVGVNFTNAVIFINGGRRKMTTNCIDIMCRSSTKNESMAKPTLSANPIESKVVSRSPFHNYKPNPMTKIWMPEEVTTNIQANIESDVMKTHGHVTHINLENSNFLEDKRWWACMEELPDMDRANSK